MTAIIPTERQPPPPPFFGVDAANEPTVVHLFDYRNYWNSTLWRAAQIDAKREGDAPSDLSYLLRGSAVLVKGRGCVTDRQRQALVEGVAS